MVKLSMRSSVFKTLVTVLFLGAVVAFVAARTQPNLPPPAARGPDKSIAAEASANLPGPYSGMGTVPTKEDMGNLAFAAGFKGQELPEGSGTAKLGADIFAGRCAMCHGANAEGVHWDPMAFSPLHGPRLGAAMVCRSLTVLLAW